MFTMKIFTQATGGYLQLATDWMVPMLQDDVNLHIISKNEQALAGLTHEPEFQHRNVDRLEMWYNMLVANRGEKVLLLDCDVTFHDKFVKDLSELLDEHEFMFQSLDGDISGFNAGIIAVVSNDTTIGLYKEWVERARATPPEGRVGNTFPENICKDLLREKREAGLIKCSGLPRRYGFLTPDIKIYHAVNGGESCLAKDFVLRKSLEYSASTGLFDPAGPLQRLVKEEWEQDWLGQAAEVEGLNVIHLGTLALFGWEDEPFFVATTDPGKFKNSSGGEKGIWNTGLAPSTHDPNSEFYAGTEHQRLHDPGFVPLRTCFEKGEKSGRTTKEPGPAHTWRLKNNFVWLRTLGFADQLIKASQDPSQDIRFVQVWSLGSSWGPGKIGFYSETLRGKEFTIPFRT